MIDTPVPMLATAGPLPTRPGWGFEMKWDGMRLLLGVEDGQVWMFSRTGRQYHATYPELEALGGATGRDVILDGEVIALDAENRPSFALISQRMRVRQASRARHLMPNIPVTYMVFDVLALDGEDLRHRPFRQRRSVLEELELSGPAWMVPPMLDDGPLAQRAAGDIGAEGVVAKRLTSRYQAGRSRDWIKVKDTPTIDVVVGGYVITEADRLSLLIGEPEPGAGGLAYRGRVATGIGDDREQLQHLLDRHRAPRTPFADAPPTPHATWVYPVVVVEVEHREVTPAGRLRHPVYIRLRPDKTAGEL